MITRLESPYSSRRSFLRDTALTLPMLGITGFAAPDRIRIGQIGTRHAHAAGKLAAIQTLPEVFEVVGIVEPDDDRWAAVSSTTPYSGTSRLTEEDLFETPSLRAVAVETDIFELVPTAKRCLEAGFHIHLDKPAGESLEACKEMHAIATEKSLTIQMGYMLRYNPAFQFLYEVLERGWLGEVTEVSGMMGKWISDAAREELAQYQGGGMFELACHLIDQVVSVLGKPEKVTAFTRQSFPDKDTFSDNQLAVFDYPKAIATVRCNHIDPMGGPRRQFSVTGTEGTLEIRPLESGSVRLGLSADRGEFRKGFQDLNFPRKGGRYDAEFLDLAQV
ncbi:MAG: Gfo/Idh/MocA family oxidoreductase, partial [Verrucomicrobiota bacterium]